MEHSPIAPELSIVVPLYNEEDNVVLLHEKIVGAVSKLGRSFEVIFVDDGSSDRTVERAKGLSPLTLIEFRKNFGQTAAFDAGFKQARGTTIITLDGDLQNDPADIPLLLAELEKGHDVVSGWRWQRKDKGSKRFVSRGADKLRKILFKDTIHDSGCALKAYRRECFDNLDLFGEMHRFIPALLAIQGFKIGEVKVSHHPRVHGKSKYGNFKRSLKSFVDMLSVWFWGKYAHRPLHLFGTMGFIFFAVGGLLIAWMALEKLLFGTALSDKIWPLMGVFLCLTGIQFFTVGLSIDIVMKTYFKGHGRMNYHIRQVHTL